MRSEQRTTVVGARDEDAFRRAIDAHRAELHAHCYRMLGSAHDADDALQDALLRAWRGLARFEGRSSMRSWLYRIATNASLDLISARPKRVLPIDHGPEASAEHDLGEPLTESIWIGPYAAESRENVELAFIAAVQHLPATQRAALLLRDVLEFSANETAQTLSTTVPSVNGALRRARKTMTALLPDRDQQTTLRELGDDGVRDLVERYVDAWERSDVDAILALLAADATFSMPPLPNWYRGHAAIRGFLTRFALEERWRLLPTRANGQLAFGCYGWFAPRGDYRPLSLDVLTVDGCRATHVTCFVAAETNAAGRERLAAELFTPLGLPPAVVASRRPGR